MAKTRCIAVVFSVSAVRNHKNLDIFKESASRPKALAIISVNLVKSFLYIHASAFKFNMNKWQAVYKNR